MALFAVSLGASSLTNLHRDIVPIDGDLGVVNRLCYVAQDVERDSRRDVEKLAILSNAKVRQTINRLVYEPFHLVVFGGLQRCIDRKRQGHRRIVQLLGADIDRTRTLTDCDPGLAERRVSEDVDVSGLPDIR